MWYLPNISRSATLPGQAQKNVSEPNGARKGFLRKSLTNPRDGEILTFNAPGAHLGHPYGTTGKRAK